MDFKDILDRWESWEKAERARKSGHVNTPVPDAPVAGIPVPGRAASGKKANAPSIERMAGKSLSPEIPSAPRPTEPGGHSRQQKQLPHGGDVQSGRHGIPPVAEGRARATLEAWLAGHGVEDKDRSPQREAPPIDVRVAGMSAVEPDGAPSAAKVEAALKAWIQNHGVVDKDSCSAGDAGGEDGGNGKSPFSEKQMSTRLPQARLDLHGLTAAEAEKALVDFLSASSQRGLVNVLIVHGKGNHSAEGPILAGVVRRVLESSPLAGSHGAAHRSLGGRGATWVRIRKADYFSR